MTSPVRLPTPIDEPVTEEEEKAVAESREWLKHNTGIPHRCWLKWGSRKKKSTVIVNRSERVLIPPPNELIIA
jgi:hypothetical protein